MKRGADPRGHYYLVRCVDCPKWIVHRDHMPLAASRDADRHARRKPGHESYVINLNRLEIAYRKRYDALALGDDEPPF